MVTAAAITVDVTKDWFDYLMALLTAVGTVGAVIFAVTESYRRARREKGTRPLLAVDLDDAALGDCVFRSDSSRRFRGGRFVEIRVSNARGRRTAHQVETLASWWKATDEGVEQLEQHVPLRLRPERGESFSLGPGITRRLVLLQIDGSMLTSEGHPTTSIGTLPQVGPITYDTTYYLCLVTTALDADPLYVTGSFCVVLRHRSDAEARLTIRWDGPHDAMWLERQVAAASGN